MIADVSLYRKHMTGLLGYLQALYWRHWNTHWKVQGDPYYGDHLMFQRLYEAIPEEIDTVAEKMISTLGSRAFDPNEVLELAKRFLSVWQEGTSCPIEQSYKAERGLQRVTNHIFQSLEKAESLPLGHNDFLAAMANSHETFLYLITQRLREQMSRRASEKRLIAQYFDTCGLSRRAAEIGEGQPDSLPLDSQENIEKDQKGNPTNESDAGDAEHHFWDNPEKREVREFAESGALTNIDTSGTPPTPEEIQKELGAEELSTLVRYKVEENK